MSDDTPTEGALEAAKFWCETGEEQGVPDSKGDIQHLAAIIDRLAVRPAVADLEEVLADKRRLTRKLDIALHGEEGAAKQASLCDLIEPARYLRTRLAAAESRERALREAARLMLDSYERGYPESDYAAAVANNLRAALAEAEGDDDGEG